ncbi:hypothetical protein [Streptomonospora wellingtoniae]|uniref:Uncharacterized protein n=1 Tax=Streptomonospora wellingtoniae TaxID=3075544 RepID=A0ABU2KQA2_9ACTN|nr:hypothetical protein [Streptomonospora sp. DSM 45055]MDT0301318.1 hypothetical protein [Streptomonospora sp. DSM 45055]
MDEFMSGLTDPLIIFALFYIACAIALMFTPTWRLLRSSIYSGSEPSSGAMWVLRLALLSTILMVAVFAVLYR